MNAELISLTVNIFLPCICNVTCSKLIHIVRLNLASQKEKIIRRIPIKIAAKPYKI